MANTKFSTSSVTQGLVKSKSMLVGNDGDISDFESISTVTVGAGGTATITFSSIPSTYTHLQVRGIARSTRVATQDSIILRFNSDSGANYFSYHEVYGDGATAAAGAGSSSGTGVGFGYIAAASATASIFGVAVIDILDYLNTNKNKVPRILAGVDRNGSGLIALTSGLWRNTAAISSIDLLPGSGNFTEYSHFALYGIRTA